MKIKCLSIVTAALLIFVLCSASSAGIWYNANFENYNLGDINGQQGWSGSAGPVRIVPSFDGAGQCVEMDCVGFGGTSGGVSQTVTSGNAGIYDIEFYAAMDAVLKAGQSYGNLAYIDFHSSTGSFLTRFYFRGDCFNILLAGSVQQTILPNASDRQWHKIGLHFNLLANTLDVKVDDVQIVTGAGVYTPGYDIGRITFGQWDKTSVYSKSDVYIDNLSCSSPNTPAPGKLILAPTFFPGWPAYNVCYPCTFYDSAIGKYRMYYSGSGMGYVNDSTWDQWTTGAVTSSDEQKWLYPDNYEALLFARKFMEGDLVDPQIESQQFDSIFAYMPCVIKDGSTYKMWYAGWNGNFTQNPDHTANKINFRIGYATSPDGVNWTKYPNDQNAAPVLNLGTAGSLDAKGVSHPWVLKKNGTYHMWYEGYDGSTWRIFHTTSTNGTAWNTPQLVLPPGTSGSLDYKGARNPVVVEKAGIFEMWYQGESSASPNYHVLRATSSDGTTWNKIAGQVTFVTPTPANFPSFNANDPIAKILVNTVVPNQDNTYTVYYAKEMIETTVRRQGSVKVRHYFIFREVVAL